MPLVSICLPNLNNREFLDARLSSITSQTVSNWELIVVDSYSDDGAWEFLQAASAAEPRMQISQAPRGLYAGWNRCITKAKGEFVYIATSDDTMRPDCLELLIQALQEHDDCQIATCNVDVIDVHGHNKGPSYTWASPEKFFGPLLTQTHVRMAPYDVPVLCGIGCIPTSITGALYRRSVFAEVGLFPENYGSKGDYAWHLKCAFRFNKIHVPHSLATWRIHSSQVTTLLPSVELVVKRHALLRSNFQERCESGRETLSLSFARCARPQVLAGLVTAILSKEAILNRFWNVCRVLRLDPLVLPILLFRLITGSQLSRWLHPDMVERNLIHYALKKKCITNT